VNNTGVGSLLYFAELKIESVLSLFFEEFPSLQEKPAQIQVVDNDK